MKKIKLLLIVFLMGTVLAGCSTSKLSDAYDEELLKSDAKEIVNMFCNEEYDKVVDKMSDKMKGLITAQKLKEGWEPMKEKNGEFDSIAKEGVVGNDGLATIIEVVNFKNGKTQFKITYNEDMKLEGLYLK